MNNLHKIAGVLGGMGPDATVDFMAKVIALTDAGCDQDHVRMLVDHNPHVPNRQQAILGDGEDPGPALAAMAAQLEASGANFLVIPCNTAFVFEDDILAATSIPLISIITESVSAVRDRAPGAKSVGILATDGCLKSGIYQAGIEAAGMTVVAVDLKEDLLSDPRRAEFTRPEVANATGQLQDGRKLLVKGLLITAPNEKRLNLVAVQQLAETCK